MEKVGQLFRVCGQSDFEGFGGDSDLFTLFGEMFITEFFKESKSCEGALGPKVAWLTELGMLMALSRTDTRKASKSTDMSILKGLLTLGVRLTLRGLNTTYPATWERCEASSERQLLTAGCW